MPFQDPVVFASKPIHSLLRR
uniref:Uncharacterized protein n=1 Tax=Anguilla anguilla TaxID=7936 RepID=A0A0E9R6H2_ANGAN